MSENNKRFWPFSDEITYTTRLTELSFLLGVLSVGAAFLAQWVEQDILLFIRDIILAIFLISMAVFWSAKAARYKLVTTSQKLEIAGLTEKLAATESTLSANVNTHRLEIEKQESACEERLNQAHKHTVEALSNQADAFHQIAHDVRSTTYSYFKPRNGNEYISSDLEIKEFEVICRSVTRRVKEQLRRYFGARQLDIGQLRVSVALLFPSSTIVRIYSHKLTEAEKAHILGDQDRWMVTVWWDRETWEDGKVIGLQADDTVRYTPYSAIVSGHKSTYACDNISEEVTNGRYTDKSANTKREYNAQIVKSIRGVVRNDMTPKVEPICFGALVVDSPNLEPRPETHVFLGEQGVRSILGHAADVLAHYILMINMKRLIHQEGQEYEPGEASTVK